MTYVNVDEGRQGAKRQHTKAFDVRLFVAKLMEKYLGITRAETTDYLMDRVLKDLGITREQARNLSSLRAVCDHSSSNNYNNLQIRQRPYVSRANYREITKTPEFQRQVSEKVQEIKHKIDANILEQIIMPTGKTLFHSTREEIVKHRSDLGSLVKKLKPGQTPCEAGIKGF